MTPELLNRRQMLFKHLLRDLDWLGSQYWITIELPGVHRSHRFLSDNTDTITWSSTYKEIFEDA